MRKITLLLLLLILPLFSSSIDKKIKSKKRELSSKKVEYNKMDRKLSTVAKKIIDAKGERSKLDKKLNSLEKNIKRNQSKFNELSSKKKGLDIELSNLSREIEDKRDKFISLVTDKFSMALVLEELKKPTKESVMMQEAYGVYAKENNQEIEELKEDIESLRVKEEYFANKQEKIKGSIGNYKKERDEYKEKKSKKTKIIKELARDKAIYKKRFDRIRASKRTLQRKLAKLKIVKQEEQEYKSDRKRRQSSRDSKSVKTASYGGGKTISPMSGSKLIKKFGTYIDPIYKFKIFNKSITLKAPYKGSKVKSVLGGKVVFAENSGGMLGKVVIVSHPNKIHTIYAKLSRLAPGIYVGKRLSKGSVIGKVNKSLMFEVTKNNKHMNPLKLIRL
ncbi:peptidoglycan DD-metalloendopeptidase family protein [Sulfurovum sp. bin170]|uniref:murein hydrolase activator EnvC family protein n=1 Tax=Sulfurovum sp. bin170 TaxID=2695268 RepID=UPI0013E07C6F|nr:peptidoglycan DD-metalloendopeptidase family protein [Sulfurovum sp. bin170]NEW60552.1 peptidoglycan DD-metalloendopeptidase family protein [Sulfurovum sp. bin170]